MRNDPSPFSVIVGVDVSKFKLDFAFADGKETWSIDNTSPKIVAEIIGRIKNPQTTLVVMEATGGYEELLVGLLHQHHIAVAVVNPRRVRAFAAGLGKDAKTDPIDAQVFAEFCTWPRWSRHDSTPASKPFTSVCWLKGNPRKWP
jgi:transposase